jgi:pimeloyl-ACP methyl ester carboxylesterase
MPFLTIKTFASSARPLVAYRRMGDGPTIVLLHGWPATSWAWRHVAPILADHFDVIAPDLRGLGASGQADGYDKSSVANDVLALLDHLDIETFHIAGHDMGVPVAYALARMARERIERLTMLDVPPIVPARAFDGFTPWHFTFHAIPNLPETLVEGKERAYLNFWYGDARPHAITDADVDIYAAAYAQPGGMAAGFGYYRAFQQDGLDFADATTAKLPMPVLALHGDRSPLGDLVHRVAREICANLTTDVILDSGHWIPDEQPSALARRIQSFHLSDGASS